MSLTIVSPANVNLTPIFGQDQGVPVPVSPQPVLSLPDVSYEAMGKVWNFLNEKCLEVLTPAQCRALLGYRPIVISEGQWEFQVKWYWWVIIGFLAGRISRSII